MEPFDRYTVVRVLEDDFGCEGLPEGEEPQVTVVLRGPDGGMLRVRMTDALALSRCIDEGMTVCLTAEGVKAAVLAP